MTFRGGFFGTKKAQRDEFASFFITQKMAKKEKVITFVARSSGADQKELIAAFRKRKRFAR